MRVNRRGLLLALTSAGVAPGLLLADAASRTLPESRDAGDERIGRMLGRWQSVAFRAGILAEWADASGCQLFVSRLPSSESAAVPPPTRLDLCADLSPPANWLCTVRLYLTRGQRTWPAPDTVPGWFTRHQTLCLGSLGSHLVFTYRVIEDSLILWHGGKSAVDEADDHADIVLYRCGPA